MSDRGPLQSLVNLERASVLLLDDNAQCLDILVQILLGFGVKTFHKCSTILEAKAVLAKTTVNLVICDALLGQEHGQDLVYWLRRQDSSSNRFVAVILVTSHTGQSRVESGRDCGANFIVAKPLTPAVLYDRILWVARENRPFVELETYVGPDRRFKFEGPPPGVAGRRRNDLNGDLGIPVEPNMSQSEIDDLMQPQKVSL